MIPTGTWLEAGPCAESRIFCVFIADRLIPLRAMAGTNLRWCCRNRKKRKRKARQAAYATGWKTIGKNGRFQPALESAFIEGMESASRNCFPKLTLIFIRKNRSVAETLQPHRVAGIRAPARYKRVLTL